MGKCSSPEAPGYVGSHVVRTSSMTGRDVVVLDDLSSRPSRRRGKDVVRRGRLRRSGGARRRSSRRRIRRGRPPGGEQPRRRVDDRTGARTTATTSCKTLCLLEAMRRHDVKAIVYSSSAAVYGEPQEVPIREEHPCPADESATARPSSPSSGSSAGTSAPTAIGYAALRYFNAAGAHESGEIGEDHGDRETHLIPRLIHSTLRGGPPTPILGEDYPTSDGTCIRDYVHVMDLADAHAWRSRRCSAERFRRDRSISGTARASPFARSSRWWRRSRGSPPPTERAPGARGTRRSSWRRAERASAPPRMAAATARRSKRSCAPPGRGTTAHPEGTRDR